YPVGYEPAFLAAADLNGDSNLDLTVTCMGQPGLAGTGGSLVTLLGRGDGTFDPPLITTFSNMTLRPFWLRLGDLDGDGVPDATIGGTWGELVVCRGLSNGLFTGGLTLLPFDGRPLGIALGDFDNDGWPD